MLLTAFIVISILSSIICVSALIVGTRAEKQSLLSSSAEDENF